MEADIKVRRNKKAAKNKPKKKFKVKNWTTVLLFVVILALAGGMIFIYTQYLKTKQEIDALKDPSVYAQKMEEEDRKVVEALGKIMLLPDEEFEVQTILDPDQARTELGEFFKDAQNGDKLILFQSKAVLYRYEENLIINVGPIIQAPSDNQGPETEETSLPTPEEALEN